MRTSMVILRATLGRNSQLTKEENVDNINKSIMLEIKKIS